MAPSSTDPRRAAVRIAVVALALVAAAAAFARCTSRRVAREVPGPLAAADFAGPLRDEAERLLEGHPSLRGVAGTPACGVAFVAAGEAGGLRRRVAVQALCRELCVRNGALREGMAVGFPAVIDVVRDEAGWHAVGFAAPTDQHYAHDVAALFAPAVRRRLEDNEPRRLAEARLAERVRARWPGLPWQSAATADCGVAKRGVP